MVVVVGYEASFYIKLSIKLINILTPCKSKFYHLSTLLVQFLPVEHLTSPIFASRGPHQSNFYQSSSLMSSTLRVEFLTNITSFNRSSDRSRFEQKWMEKNLSENKLIIRGASAIKLCFHDYHRKTYFWVLTVFTSRKVSLSD